MSSNTNTVRYKQTARQARIQTRESAFTKGMMYTNNPLSEGYNKVLINYDIDPLDGTLHPRKGLQTTALYTIVPDLMGANPPAVFEINKGFTQITASAARGIGQTYQANSAKNSEMALDVVTYNTTTNALHVTNVASLTDADKNVTVKNTADTQAYPYKHTISTQPLCAGSTDVYQAIPHVIREPGIHGQTCCHPYYFKKPRGTFAFGNAYYAFLKHTDPKTNIVTPELHYTQYYTDTTLPRTRVTIAEHGSKEDSDAFEPVKFSDGCLYDMQIIPQTLNPSEASSAGFNMLLENPYDFVCESGANINILGVLPYDSTGKNLLLNITVNQDLLLKCYYRAPTTASKTYRIKWEWREVGATQWNLIQEQADIDFSKQNLAPLTCPFKSAVEQLILRITVSDPNNIVTQADGTTIEYVEATTAMGLTCYTTNATFQQNSAPTNYDLSTAKGMLEWKNRLVLWGVKDAETILFTSDINNPAYFPYPNNIDVLDEPIIHCMLYGDDLVAFTNTRLYRLTLGETGGIGTHTLIQKNLNIIEKDLPMFCLVKNMLFFKSGNYYYMLVPKSTSITGETTIAPISNVLYPFFDNFNAEVERLLNIYTQDKTKANPDTAAEYPITSYLENYYAYADNASVVLNFVYDYNGFIRGAPDMNLEEDGVEPQWDETTHTWQLDEDTVYNRPTFKRQLILSLIYDTESYAWRIHIYEVPDTPVPVYYNALGQQQYMYIIGSDLTNKSEDDEDYVDLIKPILVQCTKQNITDNLVLMRTQQNTYYDYTALPTKYNARNHFTYTSRALQQNYQYLDTGYRVLTSSVDLKKRFREAQFSINNVSQKALTFYTAFIVDGNLRKDMKGYTTKMLVNPEDPRTGTLLIERPYIDERYLPSAPDYVVQIADYVSPDVTPGDTTLDDTFVLDNTQFPDLAYWKIRIGVSGKGFTPRLQILSVNAEDYSILSTNWVYRTMNSR